MVHLAKVVYPNTDSYFMLLCESENYSKVYLTVKVIVSLSILLVINLERGENLAIY